MAYSSITIAFQSGCVPAFSRRGLPGLRKGCLRGDGPPSCPLPSIGRVPFAPRDAKVRRDLPQSGGELAMSSTLSVSKSDRAVSALSTALTVAMHAAVLLVFWVPFSWELVA